MEKGKFSQPRPYRDEERQIEEAFRQITEQGATKQAYQPKFASETKAPEETVQFSPDELSMMEEAPAFIPEEPAFLPEEPEVIPEPVVTKPLKTTVADFLFAGDEPEFEEEEPYDEEVLPESLFDKLMNLCSDNRKWVFTGLFAAALVLILSVISIFAFGGSSAKDTLSGNVIIAGTNLQGMTRKQAVSAVKNAADSYRNTNMVVDLAGNQIVLAPKDTGAKLNVEAAVDAAFDSNQQSDEVRYIVLLPYLELNTDYILNALHTYASGSGSTLTQTSYGLEGPAPKLDADEIETAVPQTLVITMGTPGISFDVDAVYNQVLDAYSMFSFLVTFHEVEPTVEPDAIDLQDVYEEFYIGPVDSKINMQTFEVISGSYGYEFNLMEAQKLLEKAQYGEVLRIPMLFIEPELIDEEILFRDILGEFQTALTSDKNRNTNIQLACQALNGTILEPGSTFSFQNIIGQPTSNKGYKTVMETEGNETMETMGGGISQVATNLYVCAMLSDLEIVSRTNHNFPVSYVEYGLDALVVYGGPDFKFRNNQNYPVQIQAEVSGNYVTVRILGTDERDYYVKMESSITATHKPTTVYVEFEHDNASGWLDGDVMEKGITGYSIKTYKLKYDRQTGNLRSKDYEASSRYATVDMLVARVTEPEPTVPETTVPPTTVPPETTVPPTEAPVPEETEVPAAVPQETQPLPVEETTPVVAEETVVTE